MTDFSSHAIEKVRSKKASESQTRKAFQVLQMSTKDQNVVVVSPRKMLNIDNALEPSEESLKMSDHNDHAIKQTLPRRSKRKNINAENQDNVASKEVEPSNSKSSKVKIPKASQSKKKVNGKKTKNEEQIPTQQSSLDSYISVGSKSPETTAANASSENNVFSETNCDTLLVGEPRMCVINSRSDEIDLITSSVPNELYWKLRAEQRQWAIEVTNYENAQLRDELEALLTENAMLKRSLKEAEKFLEVCKASLA